MDTLLEALWCLIRWPYRAWKNSIESSAIGTSEKDRESLLFWQRVSHWGIALLLLIVGGAAAGLWLISH